MKMVRAFLLAAAWLVSAAVHAQVNDAIVLIGHASVPRIDITTAQRLYTGRIVEVGNMPVIVLNALPGSQVRERFMATVMNQTDEKYIGYWRVRKHVGKGAPPREVSNAAEMIDAVQSTPGFIGYVMASDLKPGLNVLLRP